MRSSQGAVAAAGADSAAATAAVPALRPLPQVPLQNYVRINFSSGETTRPRYTVFVGVNEILEAIRSLRRPERLRLVAELELELAVEGAAQTVTADDPLLEERGRLLVYAGPVDISVLDHRASREERMDTLIAPARS